VATECDYEIKFTLADGGATLEMAVACSSGTCVVGETEVEDDAGDEVFASVGC